MTLIQLYGFLLTLPGTGVERRLKPLSRRFIDTHLHVKMGLMSSAFEPRQQFFL